MYMLDLKKGGVEGPDYNQSYQLLYQLELRLKQKAGDQEKSRSKELLGTRGVEKGTWLKILALNCSMQGSRA